ncbi:hypothetical protein Vretimale_18439 [Volvox reticuliferus]|nr:hypothetical protein Vretimale_18439 [Volvox reticuliferus]
MQSADAGPSSPVGSLLDALPDEILIQIFGQLVVVGSTWEEDDPLGLLRLPYRQCNIELMPSTGLRGYPFLAQVCRKWKRLLATTMAKQLIWRRLCIDLGHELVTSIHAPLRWSNQRPSNEEYKLAMRKTRVSAIKVLRFLGDVAPHVRTLSLANTGEYDGEDGLYVSLQGKHNFGPTHLGFALALLRNTLTELTLYRCDGLVSWGNGFWTLLTQLPALRVLAVEGLRDVSPEVEVQVLGELRQVGWAAGPRCKDPITLTGIPNQAGAEGR